MLDKIIGAVKKAVEIYKNAGEDLGISEKTSNVNLVTKYDKMIQKFLIDELSKITPGASFFCEEGNDNKQLTDGYCYIIDPIDGTTNFIKGFQHSAISVGLAKDKEMIIGVVATRTKIIFTMPKKEKALILTERELMFPTATSPTVL